MSNILNLCKYILNDKYILQNKYRPIQCHINCIFEKYILNPNICHA